MRSCSDDKMGKGNQALSKAARKKYIGGYLILESRIDNPGRACG
jgi:hypothetical protein